MEEAVSANPEESKSRREMTGLEFLSRLKSLRCNHWQR
jgi:hypothetical protein